MGSRRPLATERLFQITNDVIVTTAKTFKATKPDSKTSLAEAIAAMEKRIPAAVEEFNAVLDDVEFDILLAKSVLQRDLDQLRASRKASAPEPGPVAPAAPMDVDLESPSTAPKEPFTGLPGPPPPAKQDGKPVAPFPNMGFEATSPELTLAPSPKTTPKPKEVKNLSRPATSTPAASRPSSAPPKKEAKVPAAQAARPGGVATAPPTPLNAPAQAKVASVSAPSRPTPSAASSNAPPSASVAASVPPPAGNENLFTDLTFSPAPPAVDLQTPKQIPQAAARPPQISPPVADVTNQGGGSAAGLGTEQQVTMPLAETANMGLEIQAGKAGEENGVPTAEAKMDGLFDLGPGGIDLEYDLGNGDGSSFNDLFFPSNESTAGDGELGDGFFNLNG